MKNTVLWGALFTLVCAQAQADANTQPAPALPAGTTTTTPTNQPAVQGTQPAAPVQAQPAAQPSAAPIINCDYKIPATTKNIEQSLVLSWAEKATAQSFAFTPTTLDDQMKKLQNCFTEQGWTGFNSALEKSGNLEAIKNQHLTVSSQMDGQATMDDATDNQWKVTLPLQVVYQNDKEKVTQLLDIKLTVGRKVSGDLGITQMIATPRVTQTTPAAPSAQAPASNTTTTAPAADTTPPNNSTTQPNTAAPNGSPTAPTSATAPSVGTPEAKPATGPAEQQKPNTATPAP